MRQEQIDTLQEVIKARIEGLQSYIQVLERYQSGDYREFTKKVLKEMKSIFSKEDIKNLIAEKKESVIFQTEQLNKISHV